MPDLTASITFRTFLVSDSYNLTDTSPFYNSVDKMRKCSLRIDKGNKLGPMEYIITTIDDLHNRADNGDLSFLTDVVYNISNHTDGASNSLGKTASPAYSNSYLAFPDIAGGQLYWEKASVFYKGQNNNSLNGFEAFMGHVLAHERLAHAFGIIISAIFHNKNPATNEPYALTSIYSDL